MPRATIGLPGQLTLLACWDALASASTDAQVTRVSDAVAAVFPASAFLNNAILDDAVDDAALPDVVSSLGRAYADVGVATWALWVPSRAASFHEPQDRLPAIGELERDITTLVMRATLSSRLRPHDEVIRASIAAVERIALGDPVPAAELGEPDSNPGLAGWAVLDRGVAVASVYTYLHGTDCGIYAVGTLPQWRRRGLARALVEHALVDARHHGARTASLQSTPMGQPLYESLGFRPAGRYEEWVTSTVRPASRPSPS